MSNKIFENKKEQVPNQKSPALSSNESEFITNSIASREKNAIVLCNSQEKIFLSIEEAAELEELKYNSIVQKISRKSTLLQLLF